MKSAQGSEENSHFVCSYTQSSALIHKTFADIRKNFLFIESFRLFRESFAKRIFSPRK